MELLVVFKYHTPLLREPKVHMPHVNTYIHEYMQDWKPKWTGKDMNVFIHSPLRYGGSPTLGTGHDGHVQGILWSVVASPCER